MNRLDATQKYKLTRCLEKRKAEFNGMPIRQAVKTLSQDLGFEVTGAHVLGAAKIVGVKIRRTRTYHDNVDLTEVRRVVVRLCEKLGEKFEDLAKDTGGADAE